MPPMLSPRHRPRSNRAHSEPARSTIAATAGLAATLALAAAPTAALEITYLGNAGFLLADENHTVLIDALYGEGLEHYPVVDPEIRRAMEAAQPPYDEVDLVLATHHHGDHFDPAAVARHLRANPEAIFVSTPQAVARLKDAAGDATFEERAHGILPEEGERRKVRLAGLDLDLLHLHHGRNRHPPVENLGFLFQLDGRSILHVGDTVATVEELSAHDLPQAGIDIAMLTTWLVAYDDWSGVVSKAIQPDELLVMHAALPSAPEAYFDPFGGLGGLLAEIERRHPGARVFHSGSIDSAALSTASEARKPNR